MSSAMSRIGKAGSGVTGRDAGSSDGLAPVSVTPRPDGARRPAAGRPGPGRCRTTSPADARLPVPRSPRPGRAPISRSATPPSASPDGSWSSRRPMTASPSAPPSSASLGSNVVLTGRPASASSSEVLTYGRFARTRSHGRDRAAGGSRSADSNAIRSPTPWTTAFSRARSRASVEMSTALISTSVGGTRRARRATASATRSRRCRSRRRRRGAARPGRRPGQAGHDLGDRPVDEELGLGPRDERPRVHRQRDPVELLDAADVGDRLAQFPPVDEGQVAATPRRPRPARRRGR